MFTLKEVEQKTGLVGHTIRYYEKEGLLTLKRTSSGRRNYTEEDVEWLLFLKTLRASDMTIEEMKIYVDLMQSGDLSVEQRVQFMATYLDALRQKMTQLVEAEKKLQKQLHNDKKQLKKVLKNKA